MLAVAGELHDTVVAVGPDPHEAVVIDEEAVGIARELRDILRGGVAPPLDHIPVRVDLDHHRGGDAAFAEGRILHRGDFLRRERLGQVSDPDVIPVVDEDRGDGAQDPVVGELARPGRVDLEGGGSVGGRCGIRARAADIVGTGQGIEGDHQKEQGGCADGHGSEGAMHGSSDPAVGKAAW